MDHFVEDTEIFKFKHSKSEAELLRENNIKERENFFASLLGNPEFAEAVEAINSTYKENSKTHDTVKIKVKRKNRTTHDESFRFNGYIPVEPRKSSRIRNIAPMYTEKDLIDEFVDNRRKPNSDYYEDIEEIVYIPRKKRVSLNKGKAQHFIVPIKNVTQEMLNNVAKRVVEKVYSDSGTSCHQCRQKTKDQKTYCRSEDCFGVRGQFCGVCLENRYGENAVDALKNPTWHCPVCRGICNCSFCRAKEGKRPTGILAPLAQKYGHKSVKDFLDSLNGKGDYSEDGKDPRNLLGFSEDLKYAQMGGGVKHKFDFSHDGKLSEHIDRLERKLLLCKPFESVYLFGFKNNFAIFENGERNLECNSCFCLKNVVTSL